MLYNGNGVLSHLQMGVTMEFAQFIDINFFLILTFHTQTGIVERRGKIHGYQQSKKDIRSIRTANY